MTIRHRIMNLARNAFAVAGVLLVTLLAIGTFLDVQAFDRTRGGHAPPYNDYNGTPIDWNELDITRTGMAYRGHVVDILVNCTSGMIAFKIFRLHIPFREVSPRALAVHEPRKACRERGFAPAF